MNIINKNKQKTIKRFLVLDLWIIVLFGKSPFFKEGFNRKFLGYVQ
jgi:hypothetical protein